MWISELYKRAKPLLSFEIFPPKKEDGLPAIESAIRELGAERPAFISVTCGAGGTGSTSRTAQVAALVKSAGAEPLAHITCAGAARADIDRALEELRAAGVVNIMALRGDAPCASGDFAHASGLIAYLAGKGFCVGAAAYPEGHVACESEEKDFDYLKLKQDSGAAFFITQLFFDNDYYYRFRDRAAARGITLPVSTGVMPILSRAQIERMIFMAGASLPAPIIKLLHRHADDPQALRAAGIEHAILQMEDLLRHGVDGVHIYTMNHADIGRAAMARLRADAQPRP